jgi:predicted nucleic acid-binding protein
LAAKVTSRDSGKKFARMASAGKGEAIVITRGGKRIAEIPSAQPQQLARTFRDTNILLYCDDAAYPVKQRMALDLILAHKAGRTGVVSIQVLQEYFVNATRKLGLDPRLVRQKVEAYASFDLVEPVALDVLAAIDVHRLHQVSYWDALVIHCAKQSGCSVVLTEDLQHGQSIDGLRIVNPFL